MRTSPPRALAQSTKCCSTFASSMAACRDVEVQQFEPKVIRLADAERFGAVEHGALALNGFEVRRCARKAAFDDQTTEKRFMTSLAKSC
ncbi:hypothetical protein [Paraburkholderia sp. BL21I4N1]|uniref:hypothetical protein n=1 Tax=Paraburkholderia sp. BL21I4N1 TaxID=1938801 RepID=UPI0015E38C3F|nr:hypothetical protein [Paraburkholderia sp. BL21I4N1]